MSGISQENEDSELKIDTVNIKIEIKVESDVGGIKKEESIKEEHLEEESISYKIRKNKYKRKKAKKIKKKLVQLKQEVLSIERIKFTQAQTMVTDTKNQQHLYPMNYSLIQPAPNVYQMPLYYPPPPPPIMLQPQHQHQYQPVTPFHYHHFVPPMQFFPPIPPQMLPYPNHLNMYGQNPNQMQLMTQMTYHHQIWNDQRQPHMYNYPTNLA